MTVPRGTRKVKSQIGEEEVNLTKRRACAALPPPSGSSSHPDSAGFVLINLVPNTAARIRELRLEGDGSMMPALVSRGRGS